MEFNTDGETRLGKHSKLVLLSRIRIKKQLLPFCTSAEASPL